MEIIIFYSRQWASDTWQLLIGRFNSISLMENKNLFLFSFFFYFLFDLFNSSNFLIGPGLLGLPLSGLIPYWACPLLGLRLTGPTPYFLHLVFFHPSFVKKQLDFFFTVSHLLVFFLVIFFSLGLWFVVG
jgi:hypothetical protein